MVGTVVDSENGEPLVGANVIIQSEKLGQAEEVNKSNINMKLLSASRGFSMYEGPRDIKQLFEEIMKRGKSTTVSYLVR